MLDNLTTGTLAILCDSQTSPVWLRLLGRAHPAVVHFPIALLTVAAALETWQIVRRKPGLAPATPLCLILGAISAVAAALFGWFLQEFDGSGGALVTLHKWVGIAATLTALLAAALVLRASASARVRTALRLVLFAGAGLVGGTGYLGGEMVFGDNHLFRGVFEEKQSAAARPPAVAVAALADHAPMLASDERSTLGSGKVNFARDVAVILQENCLRCHGGGKVKGKFNLKTRTGAMKGGQTGKSIVPGQPQQSALYTLLVETDDAARMPPPREKQLSREQIATIRAWIEQGADWPEGVELR
jgi:mono/diheme cytochrome c family protein/uncharacterized membrane protein